MRKKTQEIAHKVRESYREQQWNKFLDGNRHEAPEMRGIKYEGKVMKRTRLWVETWYDKDFDDRRFSEPGLHERRKRRSERGRRRRP